MDYNRLSRTDKRYWNIAYCDSLECAVTKDGQLFMFQPEDIAHLLKQYLKGNNGESTVWYFNETKDREIAEYDETRDRITVNPQFCYQNFGEILI